MAKMKELNSVLERTLEKANQKKLAKMGKDVNVVKSDANHQLKIKEGELKNTKAQIEKYQKDIVDMQKKLGQAQGVNQLLNLEEKLRNSKNEKVELEKKIKEMEIRHKEQGKALEKLANEEDFQNKLRSQVDELRVWKDKVRKLQEQQEKEEKSKQNQEEMLKQIVAENEKFRAVIQ